MRRIVWTQRHGRNKAGQSTRGGIIARATGSIEALEPRRLLAGLSKAGDDCGCGDMNQWLKDDTQTPAPQVSVPTATTASGGGSESVTVGPVVNISRTSGNHAESDIAINPTNPQQIFAVSNITTGTGLFMAVSNDGGVNWATRIGATGGDIPGACCDARVEYDSFGNLFMTYLGPGGSSNYVARSVNNGASFTLVDTKSGSWDNPAITVSHNNVVGIEARGPGGVNAYTAQSTGLGAPITFTAAQTVPTTTSTGNFGDIAVLNDGSVLVSYTTPSGGQGPATDPIYRDPDGIGTGAGFSLVLTQNTNVGGFDFMPAQDGRSVDSEPSFAVAPPGTPFQGRVYFVYLEEKVAEQHDMDVMLRYSDDGGTTWTPPVVVNDDNQSIIRTQMLQQIAVDRTTGAIALSWHDARNDNGVLPNGTNTIANDDVQFFGAVSLDGGQTFENFQITSGWSNDDRAANGIDFGDWTGSDFYDGVFHAIWADNSQGAGGIPNNPSPNQFDLATARVEVQGAGGQGIFGVVYDDADGDSARDPGEGGLGSVTVFIDADDSGTLNTGDTSVVTSSGGSYGFNELPDGTYIIRSIAPAGRRPTEPALGSYTVTLNSGTPIAVNQNFGFVNPKISGTTFTDADDDGVFDATEAVRSGVTVFLDTDNSGAPNGGEPTQVTGALGTFSFEGLADDDYIVRALTPAGTRQTLPLDAYTPTIGAGSLAAVAQNFGFTSAVRIEGASYNDLNANGVRDGGEPGIAGARVFLDTNNNGTFDNQNFDFAQETDLPLPDDRTTRFSNLVVGGTSSTVNTIGVRIAITHTFIGDLDIFLISPMGTRIELTTDNGLSTDGMNVTLLQSAAASVTTWPTATGVGPVTGTWRPEGSLAGFNGQPLDGTWRLEITDDANTDSGTLTSWSLFQTSVEPNQLTPGTGAYKFSQLAAGNFVVRQEPLGGTFFFTNPPAGVYNLSAAAADIFSRDFGNSSAFTSADGFYVRLNAPGDTIEIFRNTTGAGSPDFSLPTATTPVVNLVGSGDNDGLFVDLVNGNPIPTGGLFYNGDAGDDTAVLLGSDLADEVTFSGSTIAVGGRTITYSGTENIRFEGGDGNDSLAYDNSTAAPTFLGGADRNLLQVVSGQWTYGVDASTQNEEIDVIVQRGAQLVMNASQHLDSLEIEGQAAASLTVASGVVRTPSLNIQTGGLLDLGTGGLVVDHSGGPSTLDDVRFNLTSAYNGGAWDGEGIGTSSSDSSTGLGYAEASEIFTGFPASFLGEQVDNTTVVVRYTLYGDGNLDASVDIADFSTQSSNFNSPGDWSDGDFNYDVDVNIADFSLLGANFNQSLARPASAAATSVEATGLPALRAANPFGSKRVDETTVVDDVLSA